MIDPRPSDLRAPRKSLRLPRPDGWSLGALVIATLVLMPIVSIVWIAFHPVENIWPHLLSSVLPRYLTNTLVLMTGVAALTAAVGTGAAWLVTMYRFPGARVLDHALLFPLAIPAYIGAYALADFFDYSGALQTTLRGLAGWQSARDYWFPEVRSRWAAILVLSSALYPYVYLLARAAFREQSGASYEVARALGKGPWGLFFRVGLPLARPAIAAGVALAMMETVADFGTVEHFGVQTLTTGIFSVWLTAGNAGGAAQIAGVVLVLIFLLLALERIGRRNARFHRMSRGARPIQPVRLRGVRGWGASALCALPVAMGFLLPVGVMLNHALRKPDAWTSPGLTRALANTLTVGGVAAVLTVGGAVFLVYGVRLARRGLPRLVLPLTLLGYAAPGAVLALGLLIPLAALDHRLADAVAAVTGRDPGLLLTGTAAALVLAYMVRFFGVAQGAVDSAFGRISPSLPMAARSLGRGPGAVLGRVYLPLMRGSVATALLVVFVDCVKELPATLLLRPFNYNTLATRAHEQASLERLGEAAPAALLVMLVGIAAVALLARANRVR
ncbi:iron ABC transporter permease [Cereibacter azotoformans]|uniref:Iron(III) transport system permease protein n=1 Tax=Cereibacter azotoformans TaxID=43057 RepID=A0A2T5KCY4_9RHOB|nr:iron ABC transporter permease [Cereibacter azotoformans]AXQ93511.1 iron ABC transporter permease [Cereibacter sphaeroides]MBO4168725.1 iron ABC transporter permease [Cereibacter azotoformans]PTR20283.1 iron(III) transport system permease protein [Cereibacter azotoformans]UIJ31848.1 iron ABC transporter permease [Cereibacter azotoformans]